MATMNEYLVRFIQVHNSFHWPELEALAVLAGVPMEIIDFNEESPFCTIRLPSDAAAKRLISRSILAANIYELWAKGSDYASLHAEMHAKSSYRWPRYRDASFRFGIDCFRGKRDNAEQKDIIESFAYLNLAGPIVMKGGDERFVVFEEYGGGGDNDGSEKPQARHLPQELTRLFFGRHIGTSARDMVHKYDLKKRRYISTTSMDAELALVTANIALAAPGKIFFDPFAGTGGFPLACSHFGALSLTADIDGRTIRGTKEKNMLTNFEQYGLTPWFLDGIISDLTNSPLRLGSRGWLDGIVCDPPYGVREGLKVLGRKADDGKEPVWINGGWAHLQEGFVPPKKPYSFEALMDDILHFAAVMLLEDGRLGMWMPTANDEDIELAIPTHDWLELVSVCVQPFSKWSRRLLTYRRRFESEIDRSAGKAQRSYEPGRHADELNRFRKKFFEGFKEQQYTSNNAPR